MIGFPCTQFGHQEIAQNSEILNVLKYVRPGDGFEPNFPLTEKVAVNGPEAHLVWAWLKNACPAPAPSGSAYLSNTRARELTVTPCIGSDIEWNFGKFLVGKDGVTVQRFPPGSLSELEAAIQNSL